VCGGGEVGAIVGRGGGGDVGCCFIVNGQNTISASRDGQSYGMENVTVC
jgi:hypothetical protein